MERITFGCYNGKPLQWIPVYKENDGTYILSEPIAKAPFDSSINWYRDADIRKFIINEFVPNAFTAEQQSMLIPNDEVFGDLAWLADYFEVNSLTKVNHEIFKYRNRWWMRGHSEANNFSPATNGVFWFGGLKGEAAKSWPCGIRPCIKIRL